MLMRLVEEMPVDIVLLPSAPTCGVSGVLPAVLVYYCYKQLEIPRKEIIKALR